jgi:cytochrome c peroxidase
MKKAESDHLSRAQELGCIACHVIGYSGTPAEIHHLRKGVGAGQRSSHYRAIPLCPHHHRTGGYGEAIHAGQKAFENKFGTEEELLEKTTKMLDGVFVY